MAIPHDSFTLGLLATGTAQGGRYAGFVALIFSSTIGLLQVIGSQ